MDELPGFARNRRQHRRMVMFRAMKQVKFIAAIAAVMSIMLIGATQSQAQTCSIRLHIVKAGFIIGAGGGSGTLVCHGRAHRLSVGGIGIRSPCVAAPGLARTPPHLRYPAPLPRPPLAAGAPGPL